MTKTNLPGWLESAREIQALCQTGLACSNNDYNTQRYRRLMEIAAEMVQSHTQIPREPILVFAHLQDPSRPAAFD